MRIPAKLNSDSRIGVHIQPEWLFTMRWNMHMQPNINLHIDSKIRECKKICVSGILNNLLKGYPISRSERGVEMRV